MKDSSRPIGIFLAFGIAGVCALTPQVTAGAVIDTNVVLQLYVSQLCYLVLFRLLVLAKEHALQAQINAMQLHQLAHTDPLTGISNRRSIMEALQQALERSALVAGAPGPGSLQTNQRSIWA